MRFFLLALLPLCAEAIFKLSKKSKYSHTTKVSINGEVIGEGSSLDGKVGEDMCVTDTDKKITSVEVCGCEVKVMAFMKSRCAAYHEYQQQIGQCDCAKGSECESIDLKFGADDQHDLEAMSHVILPC